MEHPKTTREALIDLHNALVKLWRVVFWDAWEPRIIRMMDWLEDKLQEISARHSR